MKLLRIIALALSVVFLPVSAMASVPVMGPTTHAFTAGSQSNIWTCNGGQSSFQLSVPSGLTGTFTVTVSQTNGGTYVNPPWAYAPGVATYANTIVNNGSLTVNLGSNMYVKVADTSYSSGSVTVSGVCSSAVAVIPPQVLSLTATTPIASSGGPNPNITFLLGSQGLLTPFFSNGTFTTPSDSSTATNYAFWVKGGGAGAGNGNGLGACGSGGGAGGYDFFTYSGLAPSTAVSITIGGGGAAGTSGGNGTDGGNTIVGSPISVTANGGIHGIGSTSSTNSFTPGGQGGGVSGGLGFSLTGAAGTAGFCNGAIQFGGTGGWSEFGAGGLGANFGQASGAGGNGQGYGAGGGASVNTGGTSGSGDPGLVLVLQLTT